MDDFDDYVLLQILEEFDNCLLSAQSCRLEGQITRDGLEQELLWMQLLRFEIAVAAADAVAIVGVAVATIMVVATQIAAVAV
ncbi:hypothetical protein A2U01_0006232 [Trifolium medium]|uniref:Uncharacterized protein n=1 Tax=Trifolium medium TaxID=97028 RepID=A0A392MD42_9FABA|nr:hypothetical protein [Trifolium medium]